MAIDPSQVIWPDPPATAPTANTADKELEKALYEARLGAITNQLAEMADSTKAGKANYDTQSQAILGAYLEVAKGQLDRSTARAEFVEKAAGTIATLYTGILAFTYSADLTKGKAFPSVGIAPTIFLGLAIVFAMFYLAYLTRPDPFKTTVSSGLLPQQLINERNDFISWAANSVFQRAPWLQTAVLSLGFGVIFLPVVYLTPSVSETALWSIVVICVVFTLLHLVLRLIASTRKN